MHKGRTTLYIPLEENKVLRFTDKNMNEPDNVTMGYGSKCYEAKCDVCDTLVQFPLPKDHLLTAGAQFSGEVSSNEQEELLKFMMFFVVEKLNRVCDCDRVK